MKKYLKAITGFCLLILITTFTTAILFYKGIIRFNYPSLIEYPMRGIDISHHQGDINWAEMKHEKIDFIIIKATEGGDFIDHKFKENADSALSYRYKVGAYHYYRLCKDGMSQARHFINSTKSAGLTMPPAVDLEFGGNCKVNQTKEELIKQITLFLDTLELVYGKPPIIYATSEFYDEYVAGNFSKNPIWIRDIFKKPNLPDKRYWKIWQFANRGKIRGIETFVDINVVDGKTLEF